MSNLEVHDVPRPENARCCAPKLCTKHASQYEGLAEADICGLDINEFGYIGDIGYTCAYHDRKLEEQQQYQHEDHEADMECLKKSHENELKEIRRRHVAYIFKLQEERKEERKEERRKELDAFKVITFHSPCSASQGGVPEPFEKQDPAREVKWVLSRLRKEVWSMERRLGGLLGGLISSDQDTANHYHDREHGFVFGCNDCERILFHLLQEALLDRAHPTGPRLADNHFEGLCRTLGKAFYNEPQMMEFDFFAEHHNHGFEKGFSPTCSGCWCLFHVAFRRAGLFKALKRTQKNLENTIEGKTQQLQINHEKHLELLSGMKTACLQAHRGSEAAEREHQRLTALLAGSEEAIKKKRLEATIDHAKINQLQRTMFDLRLSNMRLQNDLANQIQQVRICRAEVDSYKNLAEERQHAAEALQMWAKDLRARFDVGPPEQQRNSIPAERSALTCKRSVHCRDRRLDAALDGPPALKGRPNLFGSDVDEMRAAQISLILQYERRKSESARTESELRSELATLHEALKAKKDRIASLDVQLKDTGDKLLKEAMETTNLHDPDDSQQNSQFESLAKQVDDLKAELRRVAHGDTFAVVHSQAAELDKWALKAQLYDDRGVELEECKSIVADSQHRIDSLRLENQNQALTIQRLEGHIRILRDQIRTLQGQ